MLCRWCTFSASGADTISILQSLKWVPPCFLFTTKKTSHKYTCMNGIRNISVSGKCPNNERNTITCTDVLASTLEKIGRSTTSIQPKRGTIFWGFVVQQIATKVNTCSLTSILLSSNRSLLCRNKSNKSGSSPKPMKFGKILGQVNVALMRWNPSKPMRITSQGLHAVARIYTSQRYTTPTRCPATTACLCSWSRSGGLGLSCDRQPMLVRVWYLFAIDAVKDSSQLIDVAQWWYWVTLLISRLIPHFYRTDRHVFTLAVMTRWIGRGLCDYSRSKQVKLVCCWHCCTIDIIGVRCITYHANCHTVTCVAKIQTCFTFLIEWSKTLLRPVISARLVPLA